MKTTKFLLPTLIAAAAMTAPAFADYTWNGGETITQDSWQTEASWTLTDGATWPVNGTGPLTPDSNVWSGVTVSNAIGSVDKLEGWALGLTLTNTNLTVGTLKKFQGGGIITMDVDSTLTVSSFVGGNDGGTITLNNEGVFNLAYAKNQGGDGFIASLGATGIMNLTSADGNAYTAKIKSLSAVLGTTEETVIKDGLTFSNYRNLVTLGDGISFEATSTKFSFVDTSGAEITLFDKDDRKIVAAGDGSYNVILSEGWVLFKDSGYSVGYTSGEVFDQTVFIWSGEDGATWNTTDTTWKTSASGSAEAFSAGESVVFNKNASVVVGEGINSAVVAITDNSTLSLSGQSNLSAVFIQIDGGSKLDLGNLADGQHVNHVLTGTGTVSISKSTGNHDSDVNLGTKFAGTVVLSGNFNPNRLTLGSSEGTVELNGVWFWGAGATFDKAVVFTSTADVTNKMNVCESGGMTFNKGVTFKEGAKFSINGNTSSTWGEFILEKDSDVSINGNLTVASDATLKLDGGTVNATGTISSGNVEFSSSYDDYSGNFSASGALNVTEGSSVNFSGTVSAGTVNASEGTLNVTSGGVLTVNDGVTLEGKNAISGTINVLAGGSAKFAGHDLMGWNKSSNVIAVLTGSAEKNATLYLNDTGNLTFTSVVKMNGNAVVTADAGAKLFNTYGGKFVATGTNNTISDVQIQLRNAFEVEATGASDTLEISSVIASHGEGTGGLTKTGLGTLILSGENTFNRTLTVSEGTLVAANASALGKGQVSVASGANLGFVAGTTVTDVTGGIALSDGAKLVIDLSSKVGETETFTLDLITGTTITFGETSLASNSTNIADTWYELSGWDKDGWASTLNYDSASQTLSLTMTIPEPSAFGLLAGVGALALVVSRRKRRK